MNNSDPQRHHDHMLEMLFGKLYRGEFVGIDPKEIPEIIEFGHGFNNELYQIAVNMGKLNINDLENSLREFNHKNRKLPSINKKYRQGTSNMALPEGFSKKDLQDFDQLMFALYDTLETVKGKVALRIRGEDLDYWLNISAFKRICEDLSNSVKSSMSNIVEAKKRHYPETKHTLLSPNLDKPSPGSVIGRDIPREHE